ncbi:hypothetical protein DID77_03865 [Candidatus Marinamargulisbacteria bacterium SCGC AG-439-L15]|nr:hypothetical protein DID77_03865 [Candidatus Marinamargulisbacteria bacterium SCGC AG-439-L15]
MLSNKINHSYPGGTLSLKGSAKSLPKKEGSVSLNRFLEEKTLRIPSPSMGRCEIASGLVLFRALLFYSSVISVNGVFSQTKEKSLICDSGLFSGVTKNGEPYHGDTEFRCSIQGKERSLHTTWQAGQKTNGTGFRVCGADASFYSWSGGQVIDPNSNNSCESNSGCQSWQDGILLNPQLVEVEDPGKDSPKDNDDQDHKHFFVLKDGTSYDGAWQNDKAHGFGTIRYPNGEIKYKGNFQNGKYHGVGIHISGNGDRYEGDWVNGEPDGKGISTKQDGFRYEGDWVKGEMHGMGHLTFPDGAHYEGDWVKGERSHGITTYSDGATYKGDWKDGKKHGFGIHISENGDRYEGYWVNGDPDGKGVYTKQNGFRYEGEWRHGKRHGHGKSFYTDISFEGQWYDGKTRFIDHFIYLLSTKMSEIICFATLLFGSFAFILEREKSVFKRNEKNLEMALAKTQTDLKRVYDELTMTKNKLFSKDAALQSMELRLVDAQAQLTDAQVLRDSYQTQLLQIQNMGSDDDTNPQQ